jgi:hypothetical protein
MSGVVCRRLAWNVISKGVRYHAIAAAAFLAPCTDLAAQQCQTVSVPVTPGGVYNPAVLCPGAPPLLMPAARGIAPASSVAPLAAATSGGSIPPAAEPPAPSPLPKSLDGLGFAAGVAMSFGQSRVNSARVINNTVRVTDSSDAMAGIVFESHYFFVPKTSFLNDLVAAGSWGHGPFVALDASTSNGTSIVSGVSIGYMIGFRRTSLTPVHPTIAAAAPGTAVAVPGASVLTTDNNSWNFGIGFRVDPKATVLGDGFTANLPPPPGEADIRLKTVPRYGVMFVTSYSFN